MKNLIIGIVGDSSIHDIWLKGEVKDFDLLLVYYGNHDCRYKEDADFYTQQKGTKFQIVNAVMSRSEELISKYDAIWIPDDDLYIETQQINKFFEIFHKYKLMLAQPSILGWQSCILSAHTPGLILRYVTWIEMMAPCFSKEAFKICKSNFSYSKTGWGIDFHWVKLLGYPEKSVAIVDEVIAIHTRQLMGGDAYTNNNTNYEYGMRDLERIFKEYDIEKRFDVLGSIPISTEEYLERQPNDRFWPNSDVFKELIPTLRSKSKNLPK